MAEMFDVYDEEGNWTGVAERNEVHRKGLWHKTVHCWLVRKDPNAEGGSASILFQMRAANKDTSPGCFDITVAGHLQAGETPQAVTRELEEELGVSVAFDRLRDYGIVREYGIGNYHGVQLTDAEISHVFGLVTDKPLAEFRLQKEEVSGLYEADADKLIALMEGRLEQLAATGVELRSGKLLAAEAVVTRSSFVSRDFGYYVSVFKFLRDLR